VAAAQDRPAGAQPAPSPAPSPATPDDTAARGGGAKQGAHLVFEGEDGSLTILNRVQVRWTHENPDENTPVQGVEPGGSRGSFRIRRAKTEFSGWFHRRELTYELQLSWAGPEPGASTTTALEDFILNYDFSGDRRFQLAAGQFKVPLGRQELTSSHKLQFCDRDILSFEFTRGRDVGLQLHGLVAGGKLEYRAGVFNGNPASRITNDNDKYQYNARVVFQPWGDVGYSESDFESTTRPLVAFGGQFEHNDLHGATNADDARTRILGADVVFKFRGFSAFAEYFARERERESGLGDDSNGFHAQAGFFVVRDRLEVAGRYARFDPTSLVADNDRTEIGGALNYFIRKHILKVQADFRQIEDEQPARKNRELRVQTQVVF
jgi:phosphate-selective porin